MAKDLVQETYMKTWNSMVKGEDIHNIRAFFYKILGNLVVDHYRKKKTLSLDRLSEVGFEPSFSDLENLENRYEFERNFRYYRRIGKYNCSQDPSGFKKGQENF